MNTQTSTTVSQARELVTILAALALTLATTAPTQARNTETEPNNDAESATVLDADLTLSGRFDDSRDHDFIDFSLDGPLRLWRVQAAGEGVKSLTLYDPGGNKVATAARSGRIARISSLLLPPGRYVVDIEGASGRYLFRAIDQGPPPVAVADATSEGAADQTTHQATGAGTGSGARPDFELNQIESNDTLGGAMALVFDHRRTGALDRKGDHDSYRFTLTGPTHIALEFEPIDQPLRADVIPSWGSDNSQALKIAIPAVEKATPMPLTWSALLTAGDYLLVLQARKPTEWPYALTLRRRPWFNRPADLEPNNSPEQAHQIPAGGLIDGLFTDGVDFYALPVTDSEVDYRFLLSGPETGPGNKKPKVNLRARVTLDNPHFAAYARRRQTVRGTLALTNSGAEPRSLTLAPRIEHALWDIDLAQDRIEVPAAATIEVPITVTIAPDAWDQQPVWLSIAALNPEVSVGGGVDDGRLATAEARLSSDPGLPPLDPGPVWTLPEPMLGGLNLAWSALDAKVAEKQEKLIDGTRRAMRPSPRS